ncbi:hypothetical protein JQC92_10320 [Shewanella sp. 202IG2-18]|uniref:outer membrane beta-barrel protein n=1 Tax=Parashewanella hymeniacidonis TaxID=2807618 RepID=UPI001960F52F|nr:hypothetical protein [Parashewanella hymeniacidonis]MBM7072423.1 hypothetical protein [Parashewanella hymeniacidonis]
MNNKFFAVGILTLATSFFSQAQDSQSAFSYDTVSLGYKSLKIEGLDDNFAGLAVKLNKSLGDTGTYLLAEYSIVEYSDSHSQGDVDVKLSSDITQYELGLGYQYSLNNKTDLFAELAFGKNDIEAKEKASTGTTVFVDNKQSYDDNLFRFAVGGRSQIYDQLELFGKVDAIKYSDADSTELGWTVGGKYNITKQFDATVEVFNFEDSSSWFIGGSYRF